MKKLPIDSAPKDGSWISAGVGEDQPLRVRWYQGAWRTVEDIIQMEMPEQEKDKLAFAFLPEWWVKEVKH